MFRYCLHSISNKYIYNPSNLFSHARLVSTCHVTEYSPAETGEYPRIFPNFQNFVRCEKDLKDNKHNSLHFGRKYARIFVIGCYLFLVAHSFPYATLSENCCMTKTSLDLLQLSLAILGIFGKCPEIFGKCSEMFIWP